MKHRELLDIVKTAFINAFPLADAGNVENMILSMGLPVAIYKLAAHYWANDIDVPAADVVHQQIFSLENKGSLDIED